MQVSAGAYTNVEYHEEGAYCIAIVLWECAGVQKSAQNLQKRAKTCAGVRSKVLGRCKQGGCSRSELDLRDMLRKLTEATGMLLYSLRNLVK